MPSERRRSSGQNRVDIRQENKTDTVLEIHDNGLESEGRESSETWIKMAFGSLGTYTCIKKDSFISAVREITEFPEHLFNIFDTKRQGYLSIQELIGGFALLRRDKNRKSTNWFKKYFERICEDENIITFHQFSKALDDDVFLKKLFKLFDLNGDGEILMKEFVAVLDRLECASVDTKWYFWIQENFDVDSQDDRNITFEQFRKALHLKESFFAKRFYAMFDTNGDGSINMKELVSGLTMLVQGTEREKLKFLFKVYDIDGNGELNMNEVRTILECCVEESNIKFDAAQIEDLVDVFFQEADADDDGQITFEEFEMFLNKYPGVAENLNITAGNWLNPPKKNEGKRRQKMKLGKESLDYIRKNHFTFFFEIFYILINVSLCVWVGIVRRNDGGWVILARMFGMCLNFNGMFVLILMLKSFLTWLRSTRIGKYIPIDHHIEFHKAVAVIILLQSLLHFVGHLGRYITTESEYKVWEYLITTRAGEGWIVGTAGITGILLFLVFGIMTVFSLPCVRRQGHFELFYFTHHLYIIWWILLLLHASNFWKWFIGPALFYFIERISRLSIVNKARHGETFVKEGITLPSKVTHLIIPRSPNFHYKPGNYVLVNIPEIAKYEWHPFTISSSPEMTDYIWLHIRGVGTWTKKLYDHYVKEKEDESRRQRMSRRRRSLRYFRNEERATLQRLRSNSHVLYMPERSASQTTRERNKITENGHDDLGYVNVVDKEENGNVLENSGKSMSLQTLKKRNEVARTKQLKIYVDGPYGAPTEHCFEAEHAVLISSGIGVTPFASILQTIILRYRDASHTCPNCDHCWVGKIPFSLRKLRKVDFFWINRDQASFEWFLSLLTQLEMEQSEQRGVLSEHFLDIHIYMTSALKKEDMKALGLQLALELIHEKEDKDLITGLKTRTKPGRPDWDEVFRDLTVKNHGKISVFYCGNPALGKTLKLFCRKYQCEFRKENF